VASARCVKSRVKLRCEMSIRYLVVSELRSARGNHEFHVRSLTMAITARSRPSSSPGMLMSSNDPQASPRRYKLDRLR
jgi:hypothetical protein